MTDVLADIPIDRETCRSFTWAEICCQRTGLIRPTKAVIGHMQRVQLCRDWWGAPISASGVRTPYHNAMSGSSAANSKHLLFTDLTLDDIQADDEEMQRFGTDLHFSLRSPRIGNLPVGATEADRRARANRLAYDWIDELIGETGGLALYEWGCHWDCRVSKWRRDNTR